jgi:integrase
LQIRHKSGITFPVWGHSFQEPDVKTVQKCQKWVKADKGIRYLEHPTRRHGAGKDRYFVLRFTADGVERQEPLGWASEGITLEKARIALAQLKEAKRTGKGPRTLRAQREQAEAARKIQEEAAIREQQGKITFSRYWEDTYWPAQAHKSKGSLVSESALWRCWLQPVLGNKFLVEISAADMESIKANMLRGIKAPATIKYAMAVVSQVWTMAFRAGIVTGICPIKHVALPKRDNRRQRYLTKDEVEKLLNELDARVPIARDMAILGLDCGLRFGEAASLAWQDVNFQKSQMLIRDPKAKANRYAFMTNRVKTMLEDRYTPGSTGLIFLDKNGKKFSKVSRTFRRIADELFNTEVTDPRLRVCFHTLRHTFASWLVEGGVSLYEVKELMGHADFGMTQRYSHLSPEGLRAAITVLEK